MIFNGDNKSSGRLGAGSKEVLVDWLQGKGVNDTNIDALPLELFVGGQSLV